MIITTIAKIIPACLGWTIVGVMAAALIWALAYIVAMLIDRIREEQA